MLKGLEVGFKNMFGLKGIIDKILDSIYKDRTKIDKVKDIGEKDNSSTKDSKNQTKAKEVTIKDEGPKLHLIKNASSAFSTSGDKKSDTTLKQLDREYFYKNYRIHLGRLSQEQVDALNDLLKFIDKDPKMNDTRRIAYVLATVYHETAHTYKPISEYGKGRGRKYGKPHKVTGKTYYGRGYVQLTWYDNYVKFARLLEIDLVWDPEKANDPETAYKILSIGMRHGLYTGKKLSDYINNNKTDYRRARRIVNGNDKAHLIASYARKFEKCLKYKG